MNSKNYIITLILLIISSYGLSQARVIDPMPSMSSPTVANLAKSTEFPEINQFGLVPIEIPLWELKYKEFSLPLKLSYHASGIQVSPRWLAPNVI
ncbi:MAG: hypothetical protein MI922_09690 [Bacteroidales bacterium]|nr:hypothetical protein [Bacteroidales bacterium]